MCPSCDSKTTSLVQKDCCKQKTLSYPSNSEYSNKSVSIIHFTMFLKSKPNLSQPIYPTKFITVHTPHRCKYFCWHQHQISPIKCSQMQICKQDNISPYNLSLVLLTWLGIVIFQFNRWYCYRFNIILKENFCWGTCHIWSHVSSGNNRSGKR